MKKIILSFLITFAAININAQSSEIQKYIGGKRGTTQITTNNQQGKSVVTVDASNEIYKAGELLEKSAKMQYYSIGLGIATGGIIWATRNAAEPVRYICSGIAGVATVACAIMAIDYKLKAGKALKIGASNSGGAIAYVF